MIDTPMPSDIAGAAPIDALVHVPSQVPDAIYAELVRLGRVVAPQSTEALYAPLSECEPYAGVLVQRDVAYGSDARNLLDVFKPENDQTNRPVLLFLHGGAFMHGDRRIGNSPFNDNIAVWAARQGFLGINMTYRLAPAHAWPAAQHDIHFALAWLRANAHSLGADINCIVLMGHSAGAAHVAQYVAFPEFHVISGGGIAGAVMLSGIFDPSTAQANPPLQAYFGSDTSLYSARSAVPGLIATDVPLLLAFAELDPPDFHAQSQQLRAALCDAGKPVHLNQMMGHSHMSEIFSINTQDNALVILLKVFLIKSSLVAFLN
jgi:acetyl esterase/lipase